MFNTDELDKALDQLPHPLPSIITAAVLTLVEECRVEAGQVLCGARMQICVNKARPSPNTKPMAERTAALADAAAKPVQMAGRAAPNTDERSGPHLLCKAADHASWRGPGVVALGSAFDYHMNHVLLI
jgi:anti-sigma factor ChrR (cupin superfamily)